MSSQLTDLSSPTHSRSPRRTLPGAATTVSVVAPSVGEGICVLPGCSLPVERGVAERSGRPFRACCLEHFLAAQRGETIAQASSSPPELAERGSASSSSASATPGRTLVRFSLAPEARVASASSSVNSRRVASTSSALTNLGSFVPPGPLSPRARATRPAPAGDVAA